MTPTSVYATSSGWDLAFVWPLVRETSTLLAPNSKPMPVGSPPCATPRLVRPLIPPLSRRWRSGSKPWLPPTHHQPHLYQTTAYLHLHLPLPHPDPDPVTSHPHLLYHPPSPHLQPPWYHHYPNPAAAPACLAASASALITPPPPVYYPAPSDLNLDRAGQPLTFSSATRGPHGKEWALADEQELIKLLVTLKCLLPVIRPAKTPTYLKRVVKEKWDEVNRLRKRRMSKMDDRRRQDRRRV